MRQLVARSRVLANRLCPPRKKDGIVGEDRRRLEGFAYLYVMIWTTIQIFGFLVLFIFFLFSDYNYFMTLEDCCEATTYLESNDGVPLESCSNKACQLYDFIWDGSTSLFDNRPRSPYDGRYSKIFEYNDKKYCCNLSESDPECCDFMPFGSSCGAVMWVSGFSAVCSMLMVQVILSGFYSYSSRRSSWYVVGMTIPAVVLRVLLFLIVFYVFWGFMFAFIFFWAPAMYCDNPYGYDWWKFGYWYMKFFFEHIGDVFLKGFTAWDGHMDMDALVGCHAVYAYSVDLFFALFYVCFNNFGKKSANSDKKFYLDLTFFDL